MYGRVRFDTEEIKRIARERQVIDRNLESLFDLKTSLSMKVLALDFIAYYYKKDEVVTNKIKALYQKEKSSYLKQIYEQVFDGSYKSTSARYREERKRKHQEVQALLDGDSVQGEDLKQDISSTIHFMKFKV